jgi:hypothetical protein
MHPILAASRETPEKAKEADHPIVFLTPDEICAYQVPPDYVLVGDCHLVRGGITLIGGPPGVGKSGALVALALQASRGLA